ncbi:hypothetical protein TNCV_4709891 [Trichonephila clavipes]|nr:hypothetical protein TNCV_4709891 [Trichonephila clavipes]
MLLFSRRDVTYSFLHSKCLQSRSCLGHLLLPLWKRRSRQQVSFRPGVDSSEQAHVLCIPLPPPHHELVLRVAENSSLFHTREHGDAVLRLLDHLLHDRPCNQRNI